MSYQVHLFSSMLFRVVKTNLNESQYKRKYLNGKLLFMVMTCGFISSIICNQWIKKQNKHRKATIESMGR